MINDSIKQEAIKVSEMLLLLGRRLSEAANSNDMLILRRELSEVAESMGSASTMLTIGLKSTTHDTSELLI